MLPQVDLKDKKSLFKLAIDFFRKRTIGTLEATDRLYGHPSYQSSVDQQWLATDAPNDRVRLLKPKDKLEEIANEIQKSKNDNPVEGNIEPNIFKENFIDTYYPKRSKELDKYPLYMLFSNFQ